MTIKKRTLEDFFGKTRAETQTAETIYNDNYERPCRGVEGLTIIENFVTKDEEQVLLDYLDSQPWRTDLSRRTMHFGGTYCLMPPRNCSPEEKKRIEKTIIDAPPMPSEMNFILEKMFDRNIYDRDFPPEFCIVNEYLSGIGISAHVENFRFDEPVCALSMAGVDTMRFRELDQANDGSVRSGKAATAHKTGNSQDITLPRRSLLLMRGPARNIWQHEIVRGRRKPADWRRVSLTFRVLRRSQTMKRNQFDIAQEKEVKLLNDALS